LRRPAPCRRAATLQRADERPFEFKVWERALLGLITFAVFTVLTRWHVFVLNEALAVQAIAEDVDADYRLAQRTLLSDLCHGVSPSLYAANHCPAHEATLGRSRLLRTMRAYAVRRHLCGAAGCDRMGLVGLVLLFAVAYVVVWGPALRRTLAKHLAAGELPAAAASAPEAARKKP